MKNLVNIGLFFLCINCFGQEFLDWGPWLGNIKKEKNSFQDAVNEFETYWKDKNKDQKGNGYKIFKRWEYYWKGQLNKDGSMPHSRDLLNVAYRLKAKREEASHLNIGNWQCIGPYTYKNNGSWSAGQGRINVFIEDPNTSTTLYAGAPNGGIWKSVDDGETWKPLSDFLGYIGVSGIAVAKKNGSEEPAIYILTGDDDGEDSPGIGVWKSNDGGESWEETGRKVKVGGTGSDIWIDPSNNNNLWVATTQGIYYSKDAADTWVKAKSGHFKDFKLKPNDANTIYAATTSEIYKSIDGGISFEEIHKFNTGGRIVLAVTPAEPSAVFALRAEGVSNGGLWKSVDGENFELLDSGPPFGNQQAGYNLALAVSDKDPSIVYRGCLDVYKSVEGGKNFTKLNNWDNPEQSNYTHADIHFIKVIDGKVYVGSDGGAYRSLDEAMSFEDLTRNGLAVGQFYKLAGHPDDAGVLVGGLQDNGGYTRRNGSWNVYYGADGTDVAVQGNDPTIVYGFTQNAASFFQSVNGGPGKGMASLPGGGKWITPLVSDKEGNLYAGGKRLYKYNAVSNMWTPIGDYVFSSNLEEIVLTQTSTNVFHTVSGTTLFRSVDGGISWKYFKLPGVLWISSVEVDESNPDIVWATSKGKVFKSTDGCETWVDISEGLPPIRIDIIKKEKGAGGKLYLGNALGVWYRNDKLAKWIEFSRNLPHVMVTDLEINEKSDLIRASTYGRGVWESPLAKSTSIYTEINKSLEGIKIYPNPTNGSVNLSIDLPMGSMGSVKITNILGETMYSKLLNSQGSKINEQIDIKGPNGIYIITVKGKKETFIRKILKYKQ